MAIVLGECRTPNEELNFTVGMIESQNLFDCVLSF